MRTNSQRINSRQIIVQLGVLLLIATMSVAGARAEDAIEVIEKIRPRVHEVLQLDPDEALALYAGDDHPLLPAMRYAVTRYHGIGDRVRDYTCTMYRRERIGGKLRPVESMDAKVRHEVAVGGCVTKPMSIYLRFRGPRLIRGREVLYVCGQNDGKMIVAKGGQGVLASVTLNLDPSGPTAMSENRYPITEFGVRNLAMRLLEVGEEEMRDDKHPDRWEVKIFSKATIGSRSCTCIQVRRTVRLETSRFHLVQIFMDNELEIPVRYVSYDWPPSEGGSPVLLEEYTFNDIRLNVGLTDLDFHPDNPRYRFSQSYDPDGSES